MHTDVKPHVVAVLAPDGVIGFDLSIPCQVFGSTRVDGIGYPYEVRVCSSAATVGSAFFGVRAPYRLRDAATADTVIVPGIDRSRPINKTLVVTVRKAAARGARVASICTGAFVLAEAGLLDGRTATTHWLAADDLARRYPRVDVDPSALYTGGDGVFTSAGAATGLDLCLHLVHQDHGAPVAAATARSLVVPPSRDGSQNAYTAGTEPAPATGPLGDTLDWMLREASRPLTLQDIAAHAGLSVRTLTRHFREQTGISPLGWLQQQRLRLARELLETTDLPVPEIAARTGHGSATSLRNHFARELRVSPQRYRFSFGVNPDCGLKTRGYPETEASLRHLVAAATEVRSE